MSLARRSLIREKSSWRNLPKDLFLVSLAMLMRVPSSSPEGCGLISLVAGGILSVALSKVVRLPSGSVKVIRACGLTIAVCRRYSRTDCLPPTYRPFIWYVIFVPCSFPSQMKGSSFSTSGRFLLVLTMISMRQATSSAPVLEMTTAGFPVVIWPYITVADIPIPCCPRDWRTAWKREPYRRRPNTFGMAFLTIPGPLSSTLTRNSSFSVLSTVTTISGSTSASSQASKELSTASLMPMISAFDWESKPNMWRLRSKNSETDISFCFFASSSAIEPIASPLPQKNRGASRGAYPPGR